MTSVSYPNAPVRLVVLSVQFPMLPGGATVLAPVREALREQFPLADTQREAILTLTADGVQSVAQQMAAVPTFSTRDRQSVVAVRPDQLVIETRRYDNLEWFLDLITLPLQVAKSELKPDAVVAIGHRFIDEVHLPTGSGKDPNRWFHPALTAMSGLIEPTAEQWQAVLSFKPTPEAQLTLRYGPIDAPLAPAPGTNPTAFTDDVIGLDWDTRWTPAIAPEFDVERIIEQVRSIYAPVRELFRRVCTDELREHFNERGAK